MRRLALLALAGCGRFGFSDQPDAAMFVDAPDAPPGAHCTAQRIANFDYAITGATDLAATQLPNGYAIGALFGASTFWGVALDASLTANTDAPFHTTPTGGGDGMYTNGSLYFDGTNLDGALSVNDGSCFLKTFQTDMTIFLTAPMRTGQVGEPSIARAGTTLISTWFSANNIYYVPLLADGTPDTTDKNPIGSTVANIVHTSIADGPAAVIIWNQTDGQCAVGGLGANGEVLVQPITSGCTRPYIHGNGVDAVAAYERSGVIETIQIGVTAIAEVTPGPERQVGTGSDPRIVEIAGARWVAWHDNSRLHLAPLASLADTPIVNAPSGLPDVYEPAGPTLFAIWGSQLWAITCP